MLEQIPTLLKSATPKVALAVFLCSSVLLFAPLEFVMKIGLESFRNDYVSVIGFVFLASGVLTLLNASHAALNPIKTFMAESQLERNTNIILNELTAAEKAVLRPYILGGENTQYFPISDGISSGLQTKGILYRASNLSLPGPGSPFAYNLQPIARKLLNRKSADYFDIASSD